MASMIDIVFLLIIFFVVTAEIDQDLQDDRINLSAAPNGSQQKKKLPESITVSIRSDGETAIDGNPVTSDLLLLKLRQEVRNWGSQPTVIIRADRDVTHEHVQKVIEVIRLAGLCEVKFNAEIKN